MPFQANLLEDFVFLKSNLGPKPILDIWSALALPVVQAAIETGIFVALREQPATADEVATRAGIDARGAAMILPVLESLDYVTLRNGKYQLSAVTKKWLSADSAINFTPGFAFWGAVIPRLWHNLAESLRTGAPPMNLYAWIENEPETSQNFQAWMVALAEYGMSEVIERVKPDRRATRLLDVGGGHGLYALAYCEHYSNLYATVLDSPRALESAVANIVAKSMSERVTTQTGNFIDAPLPTDYDVMLLFNIIHGLDADRNAALVQSAADALTTGGEIFIMEQLAGGGLGPLSRGLNRLLGLNYYHLLGGQTYSYEDVVTWLHAAGCEAVRRIDLRRTPGVTVVVGRKL